MGRRHLLETRIVMKNSLYVVGMKIPGSGSIEEAVSILRSNEFFGQYGKIARLYLRDRAGLQSPVPGPDADSAATAMGIYIVYVRREDAARAIAALDGIPAPQGPPGQILQASYGTTRYCEAFLRGIKCDHAHCPNLHEWGGEGDSFTRTDLITALTRPAEYDARQKQSQLQPPPFTQKSAWPKPSAEDLDSPALPRTANWAVKPAAASGRPLSSGSSRIAPVGTSRPTKLASTLVPLGGSRSTSAFPPPAPSPVAPPKEKKEKKHAQNMARARSETSSVASLEPSSGHASPKKKSFTSKAAPVVAVPPVVPPPPVAPPGIAPPPGLSLASSTESKRKTSSTAPKEEEREQPEAGPSRPPTPPAETEYPIHSPYPDFDDVFTQPEARKQAFEFSLGLDENEQQRLLALSHQVGGFEPSAFDPLLEQLPKLGIPLASLLAVRDESGPIIYSGPFAPFAPASPVETHSQPTSEEPEEPQPEDRDEPAQRTTSRFDFARRPSDSPFRRDEWRGAAPGQDEMRFHPALAQLNTGGGAAQEWDEYPAYRSSSVFSREGQAPQGQQGQPQGQPQQFYYDSPQREMYSPANVPNVPVPPGYEYPSPNYQSQGMFRRF